MSRRAAAFALASLAACTPPSQGPRTNAAPQTGASAAAPQPMVSGVAVGWEVQAAQASPGPVLVFDRAAGALFSAGPSGLTMMEQPFAGLPTGADVEVSLSGAWPEGARATLTGWALPGERVLHYRRAEGRWIAAPAENRRSAPGLADVREADPAGRVGPARPPDSRDEVAGATAGEEKLRVVWDREGAWTLERWRPGDAAWVREKLPRVPSVGGGSSHAPVVCASPRGAVYVLRYGERQTVMLASAARGAPWKVVEIPGEQHLGLKAPCAVAGDGSVWVALDGGAALHRTSPEGVIDRVALPALPLPRRSMGPDGNSGGGVSDERADAGRPCAARPHRR